MTSRRPDRTLQRAHPIERLALLVLILALVAACLRPPEPPPPESRFGRTHHLRLLDGSGALVGHFRQRRRSITASDARGVRLGRARAAQGAVEASDRNARLLWRLRPDQDEGSSAHAPHRVRVEAADDTLRGHLLFDDESTRLVDTQGHQLGEVRPLDVDSLGEIAAIGVYGAPGTDLVFRVVPAARNGVVVESPAGEPVVRLEGLELGLATAGAITFPPPMGQGETADLVQQRLFAAAVLLYVKVYLVE